MENARQKFFNGQSVASKHLNQLQDYTEKGQANLISALLGYGIVEGFEVSQKERHIISVGQGLAFNLAGERLILSSLKDVNLIEFAPIEDNEENTIKIGITLDYIKTNEDKDIDENIVYTKWTPTVQIHKGRSLGEGVFEIAEAVINKVTVVKITSGQRFTTLQKQIQNTSALSTTTEQASLQSQLLSLLASTSTSIESPLINLITQDLQINGTDYMEMGVNDNGNYVKFECGLCIIIAITLKTNGNSVPVIYPISTIASPIILSTSVFNSANHWHTQWTTNTVLDWYYRDNYFLTTGYGVLPWTVYTFAIGYWK